MASSYSIVDEPRPSTISHLSVNPFWPFFGIMFVGAWFSWGWFLLNSHSMGSPNQKREIRVVLVGLAGSAVVLVLALLVFGAPNPEQRSFDLRPYVLLLRTVWQLGVSYYLYMLQAETFGLYEHFGGTVRNGFGIFVIGALLGRRLTMPVFEAVPLLGILVG